MHALTKKQLTREEAANKILDVIDSEFFKALAEPLRVELIKVLLLHGPADINSISKHIPPRSFCNFQTFTACCCPSTK
ncbi:MAG: hypothetical protein HY819_25195 [Acidobacteria bacterium]|nr:hypothetical protein [Acidobacteriota bacterium]